MVESSAKSIPRSVGSPNPHRNGISSQKSLFPRRDRPPWYECAPDDPHRVARIDTPTHTPHRTRADSSVRCRTACLSSHPYPIRAITTDLGSPTPRATAALTPTGIRRVSPLADHRSAAPCSRTAWGKNLGCGSAPADCLVQSTRSAGLRAHPTGVFLSCRIPYP